MLKKIISDGPPRMIRAAGRIASAFGLASDGAPDRGSFGKEPDPAGLAVADEPIEPPDDTTAASIERSVRESDATLWLGPTTAPSRPSRSPGVREARQALLAHRPVPNFNRLTSLTG